MDIGLVLVAPLEPAPEPESIPEIIDTGLFGFDGAAFPRELLPLLLLLFESWFWLLLLLLPVRLNMPDFGGPWTDRLANERFLVTKDFKAKSSLPRDVGGAIVYLNW